MGAVLGYEGLVDEALELVLEDALGDLGKGWVFGGHGEEGVVWLRSSEVEQAV